MSAGREFQVDGAATEKAQRTSSVCMRGMTSSRASDERRARGGAWSAPCESVGCRLGSQCSERSSGLALIAESKISLVACTRQVNPLEVNIC